MSEQPRLENAFDIAMMKKLLQGLPDEISSKYLEKLEPNGPNSDNSDNADLEATSISSITQNSMREKYEKMRYQKLYGKDPVYSDTFPEDFLLHIRDLEKKFPTAPIIINAFDFHQDDFAKPLPAPDSIEEKLLDLLYRRVGVRIMQNTRRKTHIQLYCNADQLSQAINALESFAVVNILSKEFRFGIHAVRKNLTQKINSVKEIMPYYLKQSFNSKIRKPTDAEFEVMLSLSHEIFPYLRGRSATLQKIVVNKLGQQELRFYRHKYNPSYQTIVFNTLQDLKDEINKGAFCFIVDSSLMGKGDIPKGPYFATIDLDSDLPLNSQLEYIDKFSSFLRDVGINNYSLMHSGNKSIHYRFSLWELGEDECHTILPRLEQYDTFIRRRSPELRLTYVRDAVEILILAFNTLILEGDEKVCCRIPRYANKSKYPMVFDNRTQINGGARIPLSFHTKSGRFSIIFEKCKMPDNDAEIMAMCSIDYIKEHPEKVRCPEVSKTDMIKNKNHLFKFTDTFIEDNFEKLVYRDKVFLPA